jgi:hyperosmotically inducible periplasmic protein
MITLKTIVPTLLCSIAMIASAQDAPKPDNTKVNKGDEKPGAVTADPSDQDVTQNIRKSIMADKSLSTYAHNVKIITQK